MDIPVAGFSLTRVNLLNNSLNKLFYNFPSFLVMECLLSDIIFWQILCLLKDGVRKNSAATQRENKILICMYANEFKYTRSSHTTSSNIWKPVCDQECVHRELTRLTSGLWSRFLSVGVVNVSKANFLFPESERERFDVFLLWRVRDEASS